LGTYERAKGALQEARVAYADRYVLAPQNMTIETIALHEGELALPGYGLITGYQLSKAFFRFTIAESEVVNFKIGQELKVQSPFENKTYPGKVVSIKYLTSYADITSAFPEYEMGESTYELKVVPLKDVDVSGVITNLSVVLTKKAKDE